MDVGEGKDLSEAREGASVPSLHPCSGPTRALTFLLVACLLCLCGRFFYPVDDPDLFWHVTIGRWILARGAFPDTEHWNFFGLGEVFRAYSWSCEVVFASLESKFGMAGLWWLQAFLGIAVIGAAFAVWRRISGSVIAAFGACAVLVFVTDPFVAPRPQVVTFILFAFIPALAESFLQKGVTRWNAAGTAALFCVWANTHLAMILGLGYLGGLLFAFQRGRALLTLKALSLGLAGTLCTPYFGGVWLTFLRTSGNVVQFRNAIIEFEALSPSHFMFPLWLLCFVLFAAVLAAAGMQTIKSQIFSVLVTAAFLALGVYAVKFLEFSALAALTFVVRVGTPLMRSRLEPFVQERIGRYWRRWAAVLGDSKWLTAAAALLSSLLILCFAAEAAVRAQAGVMDQDLYSRSALDFVFEKGLPMPVLTDFSNGGYLMYRLSDAEGNVAHPVAIDGRTNILSPALADAYYRMESGKKDDWASFIDSYAPGTIVWPTSRNAELVQRLRSSDDWCERLQGEAEGRGYSVFVRCGAEAVCRERGEEKCEEPQKYLDSDL